MKGVSHVVMKINPGLKHLVCHLKQKRIRRFPHIYRSHAAHDQLLKPLEILYHNYNKLTGHINSLVR
jgi:hypothetical protein